MKKVFTNPSVIPCDLMSAFLKGCGIDCIIKNERGSGIAGAGWPIFGNPSLAWAWPEIWVRDEQFEEALSIVQDIQESQASHESENIHLDENPPIGAPSR